MLQNTPQYMKNLVQWVAWRLEDRGDAKPTKVPISPHTGRLASVTRPDTWNTFENAVDFWTRNPDYACGVGFVLTADDGLTFIDFDTHDGDGRPFSDEIRQMQWNIAVSLDSYMERSPGGGLHVICKASLPNGRRDSANGIELYPHGRYMTMTGNVVGTHFELKNRQTVVSDLWESIATAREKQVPDDAGQAPERESDFDVWNRAANAANGQLFQDLWNGNWQDYAYPSASEADYALIDILGFWTPNINQLRRMYFQSALGQRPKMIERPTLVEPLLKKAYDNRPPEPNFDAVMEELAMLRYSAEQSTAVQEDPPAEPIYTEPARIEVQKTTVTNFDNCSIPKPPGLLGDIADFIYNRAPKQVPEAAIAGAIGFVSAFAGRHWSVEGDGLSHYLLLLADSGTGKEPMYKGVDKLFDYLITTRGYVQLQEFRGPGDFSSGQAVLQHFADHQTNCFLSQIGEFGFKLIQLSNDEFGPNVTFKRVLLDIYTKCSPDGTINQSVYSDKSRNTADIRRPAMSLIGDSQHETFYNGITDKTIESGLLPRFISFHYLGERNRTNRNHKNATITPELDAKLVEFVGVVLQKLQMNQMDEVPFAEDAQQYAYQIDDYCDDMVNGTAKVYRPLWSRAYMKTMRLAALCAVGRNPAYPTISVDDIVWAQAVVFKDIETLIGNLSRGVADIGSMNEAQHNVIKDVIIKFIRTPYEQLNQNGSANITMSMYDQGIVPLSFLTRNASRKGAFRRDKRIPAHQQVRRALQDMADNGDLRMYAKPEASRRFKFSGVCFGVENKKILEEAKRRRMD